MFRFLRFLAVAVGLIAPIAAIEPGDTLATVLEAKGQPSGRMEAGGAVVLRYADEVITVRDGKVASIKPASPVAATPAAAAPTKAANAPTPTRAVNASPASKAPVRQAASIAASWSTDYAGALERAKSEQRKVFLFFTGSDWCGWCKRLDREILTTAEFVNYAGQDLVLVKLDFPRGFQLPPEVAAQNKQLAGKYRVRGYPTVIVLNSAGKAVGKLGYQEGGPGPFIDRLRKL